MKWLRIILSGDIFTTDFWKKHSTFIVFLLFIFFLYIIIGAYGDILTGKLQEKQKELENIKEKYIFYESEVLNKTLRSSIDTLLKQRNINIGKTNEPPYILVIDTTEYGK